MRHAARRLPVLLAACLCLRAAAPDADAAFAKFWNARNPAEAAKAANDIATTGASFDDVYARLKRGRPYPTKVATGVVRGQRSTAIHEFPYTLDVPVTYHPARAYQVRIQLHGGVMRPLADRRPGGVGRLAGAEQIYVMPVGWDAAPWWSDAQIDNLRAILDSVKRTYNVDENRVVLSGVSDGATGSFYVAMRDVTPYAAFLPLNGSMLALSHDAFGVAGTLFPHNLRNTVFFIVNGGQDPLYPAASVEPILAHLAKGGVSMRYRPQPAAGHDTAWWPEVKDGFEAFVRDHPRVPLPDRLTWETSDPRARGRAHWLVIDALGGPGEGAPLPDVNRYIPPPQYDPGMRLKGTTVERVVSGSNFDRIGMRERDVIVAVGDVAVDSAAEVGKALQPVAFGATLQVTVRRAGRDVQLSGKFEPEEIRSPAVPLFKRPAKSGRVDLARAGNTVEAATRGVSQLTLLVSPDQFDFAQPLKVTANGQVVFEGRVEKSVGTLLKWSARDNDRAMLFGAELKIKVR